VKEARLSSIEFLEFCEKTLPAEGLLSIINEVVSNAEEVIELFSPPAR